MVHVSSRVIVIGDLNAAYEHIEQCPVQFDGADRQSLSDHA